MTETVEYDNDGFCTGDCVGCADNDECNDIMKDDLKIRSLSDLKDHIYHTIVDTVYHVYNAFTYERRARRMAAAGMLYKSDLDGLTMQEKIFKIEMAEFVIWQHTPEGKKEMDSMRERVNN